MSLISAKKSVRQRKTTHTPSTNHPQPTPQRSLEHNNQNLGSLVFLEAFSWWLRLTEGKLGLVLMGRTMLSKSLIQFSIEGRGCVPSLLFALRHYGGGNKDNGNLLQKAPGTHCHTQWPWSCSRPLPTHASARDSWTLTGKSGSVSCEVTAPFSWVLVGTSFFLFVPSKSLFPQPCVQVMVESSDKTWSTGEGNGKPLQYSCLKSPMNSMKRQKDRTLKDELPRWVGGQYATTDSEELTPERMERETQSKNNTQLWMWLVMKVKSDDVKSSIA